MSAYIQATFNRVIAAGLYQPRYSSTGASEFMCNALDNAEHREVITPKACATAKQAIGEYLLPLQVPLSGGGYELPTLDMALSTSSLPYDFESRLAIYKNWKARPALGVPNATAD